MLRAFLIFINIIFMGVFLTSCNKFKDEETSNADLSSYSLENCLYTRNNAGRIVSWKSVRPINFYLSKNIPEEWRTVVNDAAKVWISPQGSQLISISYDLSSSLTPKNDRKNIIYWIDSGALFNYQQGQTIVRWLENQIIDADIIINSKDFSFYSDIPENNRKIHFKSLLIHEFGHALGLKHAQDVLSVMYPELAYSQIRQDLSEIDTTSLKCEYL